MGPEIVAINLASRSMTINTAVDRVASELPQLSDLSAVIDSRETDTQAIVICILRSHVMYVAITSSLLLCFGMRPSPLLGGTCRNGLLRITSAHV
jgi:hypothetical protein